MQLTSLLRSAARMAVLSVLSLLLFQTAQAQTETVLYNFCSVGGASLALTAIIPIGPLAADAYGNFYGTSISGGTNWPPAGDGLRTLPRALRRVRNRNQYGQRLVRIRPLQLLLTRELRRRKPASGQCVLPQRALPHTGKHLRHDLLRREPRIPASSSKSVPNPFSPVAQRAATRAAAGARRCSITSAPIPLETSAWMVIIRLGISSRTRLVTSMARSGTACSSCLPTNRADGIAS